MSAPSLDERRLALCVVRHARCNSGIGMDTYRIPDKPHPSEPDEMTPDTLPMDPEERPHDAGIGPDDPEEPPQKELDEPGTADRTPRP